jgi:hypothetical protein
MAKNRRESEPYMTLALAGARRDAGSALPRSISSSSGTWSPRSRSASADMRDAKGRLIAHPDISLVLRNTDLSRLTQVQAARANPAGAPLEYVQEATDLQGQHGDAGRVDSAFNTVGEESTGSRSCGSRE